MRRLRLAVFATMLLSSPMLAQAKHDGNELSDECTVALRSIEHPTSMDGFNTGGLLWSGRWN